MPKSYPVPTLVIGSIEDAQLPPGKSLTVVGRRPVSLQIKVEGNTGPVFEWFLVERALRNAYATSHGKSSSQWASGAHSWSMRTAPSSGSL